MRETDKTELFPKYGRHHLKHPTNFGMSAHWQNKYYSGTKRAGERHNNDASCSLLFTVIADMIYPS